LNLEWLTNSEEPNVSEQKKDEDEESEPNSPTDASSLRHPQHPVHCAAQSISGPFERVVHLLGKSSAVANLIANGNRQLRSGSALEIFSSLFHARIMLTPFNILIFLLISLA
jgi:hypothetical protein